jgi:hypothetical protein
MPRVGYARGPIARSLALLLALGVLFVLVVPTAAADQSATSNADAAWSPTVALDGTAAWLKLTTGEWLKGSVDRIQDETVYFDSDQFDDLDIDWNDVAELRMPQAHTFRFTGRRIVAGVGEMRGEVIRIRVGDEIRQFERKDFVSMIRGTGRELDYWSLNVSVGLSGQAGNTQQLTFNSSVDLRRETALTRGTLSYSGNVATQQAEISANNHLASLVLDVYLTRRLYLILPSVELYQDQFQNIALRLTPAAGFGYSIIWNRKVQWEAGIVLGYQATQYISVQSGSDKDSDGAIQFNSELDINLPNRFEWTSSYQPQIVVSDIGKSSQHLSSTISFDFWGPLNFDTTFQWDWVATPVANAQGTVPDSSDFRIIAGLGLDL